MGRRLIMMMSALVMGAAGLVASFMPHEILRAAGASEVVALPVAVQILGSLYLAFAMVNWMAKDSLIGGIYNRPVALGNFLHFVMGTLALGKVVISDEATLLLMVLALVYAVFAAGFAFILVSSPVRVVAESVLRD